MKHANSTYPAHQNPLGIQTSHSEEMLHIVAWGCTWHGCWIEGNNHKYEGRNEREKHVYINTCFNILKHHSSEECICPYISLRLLVCWLTWLVAKKKTKQARSTCVVANLLGMQGTENLVWANDLLKGDQDTANMISSMSHQKNINEKARDPETLIKWSGQNSRSLN